MSSTPSELEASRIQEIVMQIEELTQKQYYEPLPQIEAERLHKLQLELIQKNFPAYQKLQQKLITSLSQTIPAFLEKKLVPVNTDSNLSKKLSPEFPDAAPTPITNSITQFNPMWQQRQEITGNEYNPASSGDNLNTPFNKTLGTTNFSK